MGGLVSSGPLSAYEVGYVRGLVERGFRPWAVANRLGESTKSTEIYLHADNKLKQQAIDRTAPTGTPPGRYQPPDRLLAFLERL
jgi:hypothetical protein